MKSTEGDVGYFEVNLVFSVCNVDCFSAWGLQKPDEPIQMPFGCRGYESVTFSRQADSANSADLQENVYSV